jgi:hypothetical protein
MHLTTSFHSRASGAVHVILPPLGLDLWVVPSVFHTHRAWSYRLTDSNFWLTEGGKVQDKTQPWVLV